MPEPKKILITGASGLLGSELARHFDDRRRFKVLAFGRDKLDVRNFNSVFKVLKKIKPDFVINAAAHINVDWCERHPREAERVNASGPKNILLALGKLKLKRTVLMQISTAYVFDGRGGFYRENVGTRPINTYGKSKLNGEKFIKSLGEKFAIKYFILRSGWFYGDAKKTFVDSTAEAMLAKKPFEAYGDEYGVPVWTRDMARVLEVLMSRPSQYSSGVYHVSGWKKREGLVSKYTVAREVARALGRDTDLVKKVSVGGVSRTPRPRSSILLNTKLPLMPLWSESLAKYIKLQYGSRK